MFEAKYLRLYHGGMRQDISHPLDISLKDIPAESGGNLTPCTGPTPGPGPLSHSQIKRNNLKATTWLWRPPPHPSHQNIVNGKRPIAKTEVSKRIPTKHRTAKRRRGTAERMSSQRQPRLGITNTARTTSNTVPLAQNTWQGRMGVSHGAALVNTVRNSRTTADKVIHVGKRILEVRKVRMAVPFPVVHMGGPGPPRCPTPEGATHIG